MRPPKRSSRPKRLSSSALGRLDDKYRRSGRRRPLCLQVTAEFAKKKAGQHQSQVHTDLPGAPSYTCKSRRVYWGSLYWGVNGTEDSLSLHHKHFLFSGMSTNKFSNVGWTPTGMLQYRCRNNSHQCK